MRAFFITLFLCPLVLFGDVAVDKFEAHTLTVSTNNALPYRLLKPEKIEPGKKYPVVLFLHGAGERGTDNAAQIKNGAELFADDDHRKKYPCFVIVPQCRRHSFWGYAPPDESVKFPNHPLNAVHILLDEIIAENPIDKNRVYLIGVSMGAFGAFKSLEVRPKFFAAAIPICGGGEPFFAKKYKRVPIWIFHGEKDTVVPPEKSKMMVTALKKAGGNPKVTLYPDVAHDAWTPALNNPATWEWLFAQRRR